MATVGRPTLLASTEGLTAGSTSSDFQPPANTSWEGHSLIATGACTVRRAFSPGSTGGFPTNVTVATLTGADELHGMKIELENGTAAMNVVNDSTSSINVYLMGVAVTT